MSNLYIGLGYSRNRGKTKQQGSCFNITLSQFQNSLVVAWGRRGLSQSGKETIQQLYKCQVITIGRLLLKGALESEGRSSGIVLNLNGKALS